MRSAPKEIILLIGDENLIGPQTPASESPADTQNTARGLLWQKGRWREMHSGPEKSLAHALHRNADGPLGVIKLTVPADAPEIKWSLGRFRAMPSQAISTVAEALSGHSACIRALVLVRSDANAGSSDATIIHRLRQGLNQPDLPAVIARPGGLRVSTDLSDVHVIAHNSDMVSIGTAIAATVPPSQSIQQQWIWRSRRYECWYEGPDTPSQLFVALPDYERGNGLIRYGSPNHGFLHARCRASMSDAHSPYGFRTPKFYRSPRRSGPSRVLRA